MAACSLLPDLSSQACWPFCWYAKCLASSTLFFFIFFAEFLQHPYSVAKTPNNIAEFVCVAKHCENVVFIINDTTAGSSDLEKKGFLQLPWERVTKGANEALMRNLTVAVSSTQYNNTRIRCEADGMSLTQADDVMSDTARLMIQGTKFAMPDHYSCTM